MLYRNDEQLRLLDDALNRRDDKVRMFDTFSFEYPGGTAMNWMISLDDIQDVRRSIAPGPAQPSRNGAELGRLAAWWNDQPTAIRQQRTISVPDQPQGFKFKASIVLTPEVQKDLDAVLYQFRVYAHRLGFTPRRGWVEVEDLPDDPLNMAYIIERNTIVVGKELADEHDGILREFTHAILSENGRRTWESIEGLESGLADYFPCSFKDSPFFGERAVERFRKVAPEQFTKPYLRTMDNPRGFESLGSNPEPHDEGEVWGGAFWEIRQGLGRDAQGNHLADVLLLRTALSLAPPRAATEAWADFVRQLLEQEHRVTGGRFASLIRDVFRRRGLKL